MSYTDPAADLRFVLGFKEIVFVARRSVMTLFSAPADPWSHRTRLVLAEKGIAIELVNCDLEKLPEDLLDLNPYHSVPTLVDRDLVSGRALPASAVDADRSGDPGPVSRGSVPSGA
jgi:hypothetical protein